MTCWDNIYFIFIPFPFLPTKHTHAEYFDVQVLRRLAQNREAAKKCRLRKKVVENEVAD